MFHNGNVLTSGAVGFGIFPQFEGVTHGYEGIEPISDTLQVTRYTRCLARSIIVIKKSLCSSQGNLVHSLDGSNASKSLASAITAQSSAMLNAKDEDFYIGLLAEDGQVGTLV